MPEHTGALTVSCSTANTTANITVNGHGKILANRDVNGPDGELRDVDYQHALNILNPLIIRPTPAYAEVSVNVSHNLTRNFAVFFNVDNLTNQYENNGDINQVQYPVMGRQTFMGVRVTR
jgi:hypothetical protein